MLIRSAFNSCETIISSQARALNCIQVLTFLHLVLLGGAGSTPTSTQSICHFSSLEKSVPYRSSKKASISFLPRGITPFSEPSSSSSGFLVVLPFFRFFLVGLSDFSKRAAVAAASSSATSSPEALSSASDCHYAVQLNEISRMLTSFVLLPKACTPANAPLSIAQCLVQLVDCKQLELILA